MRAMDGQNDTNAINGGDARTPFSSDPRCLSHSMITFGLTLSRGTSWTRCLVAYPHLDIRWLVTQKHSLSSAFDPAGNVKTNAPIASKAYDLLYLVIRKVGVIHLYLHRMPPYGPDVSKWTRRCSELLHTALLLWCILLSSNARAVADTGFSRFCPIISGSQDLGRGSLRCF